MSSRALRKLQRQQEEAEKAAAGNEEGTEESEDDETRSPITKPQKSAFELLSEAADLEPDQDDDDEEDEGDGETGQSSTVAAGADEYQPEVAGTSKAKKKKKKGKKAKKKAKDAGRTDSKAEPADEDQEAEMDDIDRALKDLRMKDENKTAEPTGQVLSDEMQDFYRLLSVDSKNLKVLNEMKRLFGSSVLEGENEGGTGRRRGRGPQQLDLGAAFDRRNMPSARGQGLSERVLRKNIFIQGKEGWLNETGGGLGMEIEEKAEDDTTEYRYVHSMAYRNSQREFALCVESMDPQRIIHFLQFNPYHISGLLQVSEIAKQHQEPAVAVDLIERALFSFGRAAHSTFNTAMTEGKARLDFRRPENRELWLAGYRYMKSLGQRGTWRTAYEWAKLLFSFDPEGDPFQIRLVIDQLAVRAGQSEQLIQMAAIDPATLDWGQMLPNIRFSLALAHNRPGHGAECRTALASGVQQFPWIIERLLKELDIDRIPKSVWGKTARTAREKLHAEAYVHRAKDMWNTPEAVALLVEVAETTEALTKLPPPDETPINLNEARHIILDETPALIGLLPRVFTEARTSASDPLPPEDNEPSYDPTNPHDPTVATDTDSMSDASDSAADMPPTSANGLRGWANRVMARFGAWPAGGDDAGEGSQDSDPQTGAQEQALARNHPRQQQQQPQPASDRDRERIAAEEQLLLEQEDAMLAEALRRSNVDHAQWMEQTAAAASGAASAQHERSNTPSPSPERNDDASSSAVSTSTHARDSEGGQAHDEQGARAPATTEPPEPSDPQATQRFLAGRGLLALKDFVAAHGTDEGHWAFALDDPRAAPVSEYVRRARGLPAAQRRFILDFALPQGAGREAGEMVRKLVGR